MGDSRNINAAVNLGSRWRGISGNEMEVVEVDGDRVRIAYLSDPEDSCWEDAADVARSLTELRSTECRFCGNQQWHDEGCPLDVDPDGLATRVDMADG